MPEMKVSMNGRSASQRTEVVAGVTTFFTMAYIVIVNPSILSTPGTGMPFSGVLTATVALSFLMTLFMGLYAKLPFAVAPGMGINAFFTYSIILGMKVPWQTALGIIVLSGLIFLLVSTTGIREMIARAIPLNLRAAAAVGIGLFLTFIGLKNAGLVEADPVTFVRMGLLGPKALTSLFGLGLMAYLMKRKNPLAFLAGIFAVTGIGWGAGWIHLPDRWVSLPDFSSVAFKADVWSALKPALWPAVLSIFFTDLFDSLSTFMGVSQAAGLLDSAGNVRNLRQGLIVDAAATFGAGLLGTSSGTAYIESAAGIEVGGRTGLTSVVTALCFLPCLFVAPLAGVVPAYATAPVLILVGALMFRSVSSLDLKHLEDALPAFVTAVLIPLTFSITQGILWGFIAHTILYALAGRRRELHPMMYGLAAISAGLLVLEHWSWSA